MCIIKRLIGETFPNLRTASEGLRILSFLKTTYMHWWVADRSRAVWDPDVSYSKVITRERLSTVKELYSYSRNSIDYRTFE